ncbi:hypothetical protein OS493_029028 [Desmophyllum pertusum]|uniref:THAP-type domain-containing protein n=1 Tax=Desmophyllum pertusum TaxID=174260 RepID=A0A9W9YK35_9CNID|nr:hypothetical protein OS493_029028 [Desmophyllum pertusum]
MNVENPAELVEILFQNSRSRKVLSTFIEDIIAKNHISDSTKVCSEHFRQFDYRKTLTGKRVLNKGAVPSLFKWTKPSPKSERKTRLHRRSHTDVKAAEATVHFALKKKDSLVALCKTKNLETSSMKHELVERLALEQEETPPNTPPMYDRQKKLLKFTKDIGKLSRSYLQTVLTSHGFAACDTKDELILRVGLIANNRAQLCFNRERKMFLDLITITKELILAEKKQSLLSDVPTYKQRTFATPTISSLSSNRPRYHAATQTQFSGKARVDIPQGASKENVQEIFDELTQHIKKENHGSFSSETPKMGVVGNSTSAPQQMECNDIRAAILKEGSRVFWTADDLKGTGWHEGWYMAVVTDVIDEDSGTANIIYVVEPSESYKVSVEEMLQKGWIKIDDRDEIEQFYEIGARIKIKWSKEEIGDTDWRPGWYVAEVQDADRDNDEITVQFVSEPECTLSMK